MRRIFIWLLILVTSLCFGCNKKEIEKGNLEHVEKRTVDIYPTKFYKYNLKGDLMAVVLVVSETESFIYFKDGRLIAHWINDKAYDKDGNISQERINEK